MTPTEGALPVGQGLTRRQLPLILQQQQQYTEKVRLRTYCIEIYYFKILQSDMEKRKRSNICYFITLRLLFLSIG